jgi:hypothetical protein
MRSATSSESTTWAARSFRTTYRAALAAAAVTIAAAAASTPASAGVIGVIQCGDVYQNQYGQLRNGAFPFRDAGIGFIGGGNAGQGASLDDCNGPDWGVGPGQSARMGGTYAQAGAASTTWTWTPPSGTSITGYTARVYARTRPESDGSWGEVSAQHDGQTDPNYDFRQMRTGNGYWTGPHVFGPWINEGARWIRFSAGCGGYSLSVTCGPGADISQIVVNGLQVHLTDNNNPQASNVSGDLVSSSYWKGQMSVSAQMTDVGTGVYRLIFQRRAGDGSWSDQASQAVDDNGGRCATQSDTPMWGLARVFRYAQPCKTNASGDFDINTSSLAEGTGTYRVLIEDAAGNRSTLVGQGTRAIDRTAPTIDYAGTPDQCVEGEPVRVAPAFADPIAGVDTSSTEVTDSTGKKLSVADDGTVECPEPSAGPLEVTAKATDRAGNTRTAARTATLAVRAATAPTTSTWFIAFGDQAQATLSAPRSLTVTADETRVSIRRVRLMGADPDAFSIWREDCKDAVLEPGESCTISVRFAPDAKRRFDAGITVDTIRQSDAVTIGISGEGGDLPQGPAGKDGTIGEIPIGGGGVVGPAGKDGNDGAAGARGATGATGANGTNGTNGARGPKGAKGDKGDRGVPGPRGRIGLRGRAGRAGARGGVAYYTCHPRQGTGRYRLACFVRVSGGGSRNVSVRVMRGGEIVASASRRLRNGQHQVPLVARRSPRAGRYSVRVVVTKGRQRSVLTGAFTAAP